MFQHAQPYAKPGPVGGRLIREVISFLRSQKVKLPITSHILIAVSGGSDSVGLAHLMVHFGRRIVDPSQITLLHINHGWRGKESDLDESFVKDLGCKWGVRVISRKLQPPARDSGKSWEDEARKGRKNIFAEESKQHDALVFTGHQADDLAETVLWRILTGAATTHGGGVAFRHEVELRPFLRVRKAEIVAYLKEVGEVYREDMTNFSDRFLRARMRTRLMPEAEKLFPRAVEHLVSLALGAQYEEKQSEMNQMKASEVTPELLLHATGLKARRSHLQLILEKLVAKKPWYGEIHLPGGWRLICEKGKSREQSSLRAGFTQNAKPPVERWILERI